MPEVAYCLRAFESKFAYLSVVGADATRFLQAQTTNDLRNLGPNDLQPSALLDRKAHIRAYFDLVKREEDYLIVISEDQLDALIAHLDNFRFADKVEFTPLSLNTIALLGSGARGILSRFRTPLPESRYFELPSLLVFEKALSPEESFLIAGDEKTIQDLEAELIALGLSELTSTDMTNLRIEAGLPLSGVDFNDNLIIELSMEDRAISYSKGCFAGQEVLARVKSHGSPSRQLAGLLFDKDNEIVPGSLLVDNEEAAQITSIGESKSLDKKIALAYVKRDFRTPGQILDGTLGGKKVKAEVALLPLRRTDRQETARRLYDQALLDFTNDKSEEAITRLEEAIELFPSFENAYEALAVIKSKAGHLDEAIETIKRLIEINADSVMAHTNLSVFYMEKGNKEAAEEEKAISMSIRMREAAKQATKEAKEKEDRQALLKETNERIEMFSQVIEIDSEDLFANHGLGACYNTLGEFEKAIAYLEKAIAIKENHTVAYEELGKAFEGLKNFDSARAIYQKGIEVAAKKGDMTPLKAMQERMTALEAKRATGNILQAPAIKS